MKYKLYREATGTKLEFIDNARGIGREITPERSQKVHNHSPDGFEWGYGGSGPSQTALAILLDAINNNETAFSLHQAFKMEFIVGLPDEGGEIYLGVILDWIIQQTHEY